MSHGTQMQTSDACPPGTAKGEGQSSQSHLFYIRTKSLPQLWPLFIMTYKNTSSLLWDALNFCFLSAMLSLSC